MRIARKIGMVLRTVLAEIAFPPSGMAFQREVKHTHAPREAWTLRRFGRGETLPGRSGTRRSETTSSRYVADAAHGVVGRPATMKERLATRAPGEWQQVHPSIHRGKERSVVGHFLCFRQYRENLMRVDLPGYS